MDELECFYSLLRSRTSVAEYLRRYEALFHFIHSKGLASDYRLAKEPFKRLRDEVTPAYPFVRQHAAPDDEIQFPFDNGPHDCNVWHRNPARHRTIQITVSQGQERFYSMTELNNSGWGRGFVGLNDDSSRKNFKKKMSQEREMYSTYEAREITLRAFELCAKKKRLSASDTLIIGFSKEILPSARWSEMRLEISNLFRKTSFLEVYATSDDDECCWQLNPA